MKNLLKIAVLTGLIFSFTGKVNAAVLNSQYLISEIKKSVTQQIKDSVPGKVTVDVTSLPYSSIQIPKGKVRIDINGNFNNFTPITVVRVTVLVDEKEIKSFGAPVKFHVFDNVWVANDTINRDESLTFKNLVVENRDITYIAKNAARESFIPQGNIVKRTYRAGEIIDKRYIESCPTVLKNSLVNVVFQSSTIQVAIECEALDNGKTGDYVRVKSKQYKRSYIGKVIDNSTVLVNI